MLKDITLGQFFPGDSFIHRLDPRSKIIFTVLFIVIIFLCKNLVSYGLVLASLLVLVAISKVEPKVFIKGMKPVVFIVVCTAILNLFYRVKGGISDGDTVHAKISIFHCFNSLTTCNVIGMLT